MLHRNILVAILERMIRGLVVSKVEEGCRGSRLRNRANRRLFLFVRYVTERGEPNTSKMSASTPSNAEFDGIYLLVEDDGGRGSCS
jgi:hypothetical protein